MKRLSGLVVCAVATLLTSGCGKSETADQPGRVSVSSNDSEPEPGSAPQPPEEEPSSDFVMSDAVVRLDEESFDRRVVMSDKPVMVDFSASWCRPCRMMEPALDSVAREYMGRALVCKVDVDQSERLAERYQIRAIPAVLVFQNGRVVDQSRGLQSRQELASLLEKQIAGEASVKPDPIASGRNSKTTETAAAELLAPSPDEGSAANSGPSLPTPPEPPVIPETATRLRK